MTRQLVNIIFCVFISLGILAPKLSGALSTFIPGWSFVQICAGNELLVLLLNEQGEPIELSQKDIQDCPIPAMSSGFEPQIPFWQHLALSHTRSFNVSLNKRLHADSFARIPPKRPPPYLV